MSFETEFTVLQVVTVQYVGEMYILTESHKSETLDVIHNLAWVAPDQNIANNTTVCRLSDIVNRTWDETHYDVAHLVRMERLNAVLAWILVDLM